MGEEVFAGCPEEFSPVGQTDVPPIADNADLRVCILGGVRCVGLEGDHHHQQGPRSKIQGHIGSAVAATTECYLLGT